MLKKTVFSFIIALMFITCSEFDASRFLFELQSQKSDASPSVSNNTALTVSGKTVSIGMSYEDVLSLFGDPVDTVPSEYGFSWNIFHENYQNYIQIGIKNNRVVGLYTNAPIFSVCGVSSDMCRSDVGLFFETPLDALQKGNTKYMISGINEEQINLELFQKEHMYVTFFYDIFEHNRVTAVNIIEYETEQNFQHLYAPQSDTLQKAFETLNFYVTNALRVREGLSPLAYHEEVAEIAYSHSEEMAQNDYFDHTDLSGGTVLERAKAGKFRFHSVGENIAMGAQNTIYMHELLMNSEGHRKNILGNFNAVGMGVCFSSDNIPYLTQNFLR